MLLLRELNTQREQALANMRGLIEQMEDAVEQTRSSPNLFASASEILKHVRQDYIDTVSGFDQEAEEARANDQKLLDAFLGELSKHRQTRVEETPMQVLERIADDHTQFVNAGGQFSPVLLERLFLSRRPGEFNAENTVARLLNENVDLQARLDKAKSLLDAA